MVSSGTWARQAPGAAEKGGTGFEGQIFVGAALTAAPPLVQRQLGQQGVEGSLRKMEMKLFLSTRIHIPKPRITAPRTWQKKAAVNGVPSQLPLGGLGHIHLCPA